jgi:hypothetical protein
MENTIKGPLYIKITEEYKGTVGVSSYFLFGTDATSFLEGTVLLLLYCTFGYRACKKNFERHCTGQP